MLQVEDRIQPYFAKLNTSDLKRMNSLGVSRLPALGSQMTLTCRGLERRFP